MNFQAILANLAVNLRRPGFIKSVAGQLAVAYGSQLALEAATEANERFERASEELEALETRITASRADLRDRILSGELDAYVVERYDQLARAKARVFATSNFDVADVIDDGLPEAAGVAVDLPGDGPEPPCAKSTECVYGYNHAGDCRPFTPPRMAGGYLRLADPQTSGLLAGDGSDDQPYREVENLATVLDDDQEGEKHSG